MALVVTLIALYFLVNFYSTFLWLFSDASDARSRVTMEDLARGSHKRYQVILRCVAFSWILALTWIYDHSTLVKKVCDWLTEEV